MNPPLVRPPEPRVSVRKALGDSLTYMRRALALVYRSSRGLTLALGGLTLGAAAVPPAVAWAGKLIVDAVVAQSKERTLRWVAVELGLIVLQVTLGRGLGLVRSVLGSRLGTDVNVAILERATALELKHFEDSEFYDKLSRARREASSRPVSLVTESFSLVQNLLTVAGYAVLLVHFSPWVVLVLMVATLPATFVEMRYSKAAFRLRNWRSPDGRRLLYLEYVLANDEHAKEIKLFGLGPLLLGRYKELAERFHREDSELATRRALVTHAWSMLATLAFYGAYASMAAFAAMGRLTLGSMTMYVLAFRSGQQAFQSILTGIGSIYEHNLYMSNLFSYLDGANAALPTGDGAVPAVMLAGDVPKGDTAPAGVITAGATAGGVVTASDVAAGRDEQGIRLEGVSFRYPGQEKWVLEGIDLFVPRGQSVALVGSNGAGKTTLVKLVTRLYEPTAGRVLLDGKDLRSWDADALRARFGVVFQDFNQYQLKLRENVGVGNVEHLDDEARIRSAVERGGADAVVSGLEHGIETPLGRWFPEGVELSGGQWQKLALARGFMRDAADILVLDEPTAALDADAEHAVFERFQRLAAGRTTIIISHRFPTVRMADRILVLENGRITEDGSHAALLAANGTYARLFQLQARGYT
ncbi:MAG TPA: ABC transporter ATP-binding protein [Polyangiaceae bacterium]|nr:ABC transporter ATP-binding protein [Polyangiaceae bacterium]